MPSHQSPTKDQSAQLATEGGHQLLLLKVLNELEQPQSGHKQNGKPKAEVRKGGGERKKKQLLKGKKKLSEHGSAHFSTQHSGDRSRRMDLCEFQATLRKLN